ncbi:unnamed protein product [Zymoseptoria tritici ST99CH_1E4]|uniref:Uncharacterized protein n=1 Tax=Zymoseptoria tritici ST99CH_1E4 TaxID=1276532 RepID=A0A2H1GCC7_ZYMTR|nr:unnamed protein product [Zymoseptoria tritici ST99CH_1E4]
MKLNIGSNALLFASLVSCIPRSTLGFPLTQAIDSLGPQSGHDIFNPRLGGTYGNDILCRRSTGFPKGFIPEAPRLPVPPPRAFPGGTAGLTSGPAFSSERPKALGPGDPPPRTVTPPREDPPAPKSDWKAIPEDLDPGTGKKGLDEVRSVEEYETDGHAAIAEYAEIAAGPGPDTLIGTAIPGHTAFPNFRSLEHYRVDEDDWEFDYKLQNGAYRDLLKIFNSNELGFNLKDNKANVKMISIANKKGGAPINRGIYDTEGRFIMYQEADKRAQPKDGYQLPVWEMGMQSFIESAPGKTQNLKVVFLMDIQNTEFYKIVRANYNEAKQPFDQILTFNSGTPAFNRIMGSPNFRSKFLAYGYHHNAIGNKVPDKVVVAPKQAQKLAEGVYGTQLYAAVIFKEAASA